MTNDAKTARDVRCAQETLNDTLKDEVAGTYDSSMVEGAEIYEKFWVNPETGLIAQSYRHVKSTGFETKTTQVVT